MTEEPYEFEILEYLESEYRKTYKTPPKNAINKPNTINTKLPSTPMKYMKPEYKERLIKAILEAGLTPSKIWIYPADFGEIDHVRNTLVIVGINPNTYNPNKDHDLDYSIAVVNKLYEENCGRITCWTTWEGLLKEIQEELNLPNYAPDWTNH